MGEQTTSRRIAADPRFVVDPFGQGGVGGELDERVVPERQGPVMKWCWC